MSTAQFTIYSHPKFVAAAKTLAADITAYGRTAEVISHLPKAMDLCRIPATEAKRVLVMGAHESENGLVTERTCGAATIRHHAEFLYSLTE